MKNLLFLLLLVSTTATAQLDLSKYQVVDDTTIVPVIQDTMFFLIETGAKQREGKEPITRWKATLITVKDGIIYEGNSSGIVPEEKMKTWLKEQRDSWIKNDIELSEKVVIKYKALRRQVNAIVK